MNSTPAFPTAEALEAYYAGRWHLDVYQNAYSPEDLDRAESHFKTLREAMPRFRDGLLLLGVTLTEQRKEDEAIGVFEQIENDLPSPTDFRERRHLLEAQLLGAVAHRKRYKLADNHVAVQKLQYVATRANALVNDPQVAQWRVDFLRLYLEALVELCSALGHYQVLLNARNFGSELISIDAPPEIQLNPSEKQALDDADKLPAEQRVEERQKVYRVVKQRIWDSQNSKKRDAEAALDSLESQTPQSGDPIESEVSAYKGRLRSASGYAQYLYARDLPANEDQSFDKLCKFAIEYGHDTL